jgi:hypothetical protein
VSHHLCVVAALGVVGLAAQQLHLLTQAGGLLGDGGLVGARGGGVGLQAGARAAG